ncbi:Outer membrane protein beta-barrel family protein [Chitinophaga jiangningensis]|uniref:Outer membrane protein beta-barrel family protein n=1 Tax=Chitinophaga jiangningensis TaxID=1419482 RepID=A0A1M6Y317_9BACT|nr:outer membrane beta-barrel protein [Chitinophaga jiangningensis]SHL12640.1 Outer membrane protein beta-barrel family protein [Chitinophaga jiangningensis]
MKFVHILFYTLLIAVASQAQKKDSTTLGSIHGNVKDSAYDFVLPAATIAVYRAADSSLLTFQLTDGLGDFHIEKVPLELPLKMVVTFMGYQPHIIKTKIQASEVKLDLKIINMERGAHTLKDVVITRPPVEMNGDTLEFNADAFRLDSNAVIEDLFKRLPGITVWGDGAVTVNGRTISKILIDGKEFFGGNINMALENIPKQAVDKIQVYQHTKDPTVPSTDSTTDINIKLKKDWKTGKFGKVSAGAGTDDRYEADLMLSGYTPKTQVAVVAATNNINKSSNNLNDLFNNGSYKSFSGIGAYRPDFSQSGIRKTVAGGLIFRNEFIEGGNDYSKKDALDGNFKVDQGSTSNLNTNTTTTLLTAGQSQTAYANNANRYDQTTMSGSVQYGQINDKRSLNIVADGSYNNRDHSNINSSNNFGTNHEALSNSTSTSTGTSDTRRLALNVSYGSRNGSVYTADSKRLMYTVNYRLTNTGDNSMSDGVTTFNSLIDHQRNQYFNRRYNNNSNATSQVADFNINNLSRFILPASVRKSLLLNMSFKNTAELNGNNNNANVLDFDTTGKRYQSNAYLSNSTNGTTIREVPQIEINRTFFKFFANRYNRSITFAINGSQEFFFMKNNSDKAFQNLSRQYSNFLPGASIRWNKYVDNRSYTSFNLDYKQAMAYPTINQLAPLIDSSNVMNITTGNLNLESVKSHEIKFNYNYNSQSRVNTFFYGINSSYTLTPNAVADSTIYDEDGKTRRYWINGNGRTIFYTNAYLKKGLKIQKHTISVEPNFRFSNEKFSTYVNSINSEFSSNSLGMSLAVNYEWLDKFRVSLKEDLSMSTSKQSYRNNTSDATNNSLALTGSWQVLKGLWVQSMLERNTRISTGIEGNRFTIWSANVTYRFLKGKNAEVRLAAFDILHQNQGLQTYTSGNIIQRSQNNVMQQFFLCTFAYYPRFFAQRSPKKAP